VSSVTSKWREFISLFSFKVWFLKTHDSHGGQTAVQCKKKVVCPVTCPVACPVKGWSYLCHTTRIFGSWSVAVMLVIPYSSLNGLLFRLKKKLWKFWEAYLDAERIFQSMGRKKNAWQYQFAVAEPAKSLMQPNYEAWDMKICAIKSRLWFVS